MYVDLGYRVDQGMQLFLKPRENPKLGSKFYDPNDPHDVNQRFLLKVQNGRNNESEKNLGSESVIRINNDNRKRKKHLAGQAAGVPVAVVPVLVLDVRDA